MSKVKSYKFFVKCLNLLSWNVECQKQCVKRELRIKYHILNIKYRMFEVISKTFYVKCQTIDVCVVELLIKMLNITIIFNTTEQTKIDKDGDKIR